MAKSEEKELTPLQILEVELQECLLAKAQAIGNVRRCEGAEAVVIALMEKMTDKKQ